MGDGWKTFVFTDRGLESAALFRALAAAGCHPMMRVKEAGRFRPKGWKTHRPMGRFAARDGARFAGRGTAYKSAKEPLECTLLACRMPGCAEPWLILTDLAPNAADAAWYGFRAWIEPLFRLTKRGGWQWQRTRMTDPDRVERVWAAMALATLWAVEVGGAAECDERAETKAEPKTRKRRRAKVERAGAKRAPERPKNRPGSEREHRVFTRGLAIILATLLNGELPVGRFVPEPWPSIKRVAPIGEAEFEARESTYP